jgi:hypothetical protein
MIVVRYADDLVVGFEHEGDARRFLDAMHDRLGEFALSLHPDKTRLIEFGRFAANDRKLSPRQLPASTEDPTRPHAAEAWGHQGGATAQDASADSRAREMAEAGPGWPLRLLRGSDK